MKSEQLLSSKMLYIRALTPLHVGSGRGSAFHVDLPVQRDEFGFPTIWSSSIKGALRSWFKPSNDDEKRILRCIFGPEPGAAEVSDYGSSISILDARLILIPVRSLKRIWIYATSPHMLEMLNTYFTSLGRGGMKIPWFSDKAIVSREDVLFGDVEKYVIVNEVRIPADSKPEVVDILKGRIPDEVLNAVHNKGLVILPDMNNLSRVIVNKSMMIQYRVRLKEESKIVETGGLWSEEYVPAESLFVSAVICKASKCLENPSKTCETLIKRYSELYDNVIYIGGRETIGKGLIKLYWW